MKIVIVYGKQGCGKTRNAKLLAKHLNCGIVWDEGLYNYSQMLCKAKRLIKEIENGNAELINLYMRGDIQKLPVSMRNIFDNLRFIEPNFTEGKDILILTTESPRLTENVKSIHNYEYIIDEIKN